MPIFVHYASLYEDKEKVADMALHFIKNNPYDTPEELIEKTIPCLSESMIETMIESLEAWNIDDDDDDMAMTWR